MKNFTRFQLSTMMFLEFFIWGGWFVTLGTFLANNLNASSTQIASAFSTQAWGAIIAPFIVGIIADRYFNAEKILAILHLIGAFLMYQMAYAQDFTAFYPYVLGYMIAFMPTLALVNSVSFNQLKDPAKEFSFIRVFGSIGWIIAGLAISIIFSWDSMEGISAGMLKNTFLMTAVASAILGIFSFFLPRTPPRADTSKKINISEVLGLDALRLLKSRNFLIFFISSILISIPLAFYYQNLSPFLTELEMPNSTAKAAIGQVSEVLFMLLIPFFLRKWGIKKTLLMGMAAWGVRYLLFAYGDTDGIALMLLIGIALHGLCYDFFFVSGQIYTDSKAGEKFKSSAQGLITLATYGVGMLIGFYVAGMVTQANIISGDMHDWNAIWTFPAIFAFVIMILFALFFKNEKLDKKEI